MRLYVPDLKKEEGKFLPFNSSIKLEINNDKIAVMDVRLQAAYIPNRVLVKGKWQVDVEGECSRCLEKSTYCLKENFYEEFIHLKGPAELKEFGGGMELEKGERFVFKGELLDLTEYFRQSFFMSQPLKILCQDDCKGLCPACGVNKNREQCQCVPEDINPRWAVLEKMRGDL
jgi:uncharacterized protein